MSWGLCFPQGIHDYLHQQFWGIVAHKKGTAAWFSFMHFTVIQCSQLSSMCYCLINFCSADGRDSLSEVVLSLLMCVFFIICCWCKTFMRSIITVVSLLDDHWFSLIQFQHWLDGLAGTKLASHIHGSQTMILDDFGDLLTLPPPPWGSHLQF